MKLSRLKAFCFACCMGLPTVNAAPEPNAKAAAIPPKSSLRVVGDTLYFLNNPPDKEQPRDFKNKKAIDTHYNTLLAALKKRNAVQDARFAFKHRMGHFITTNGRNPSQHGRGNPLGLSAKMNEFCPKTWSALKWLEGTKFARYSDCSSVSSACLNYGLYGGYDMAWNKEMARLCKGGK